MKELLEALANIKYAEGVKQSFEDEGAVLEDVVLMRQLTSLANLYMNVKIGGCEAKTDIRNCINMGADGIVAPMIESPFALQKFIESTSNIKTNRFNKLISDKIDANWDHVMEGFLRDGRVGHSHTQVPGPDGKRGFGGSCFPKDIQAMIKFSESIGIEPNVLRGSWKTNLEVRPEKDWENLKGRAIEDD